jgi:hypothetical protein
MNEDQKKAFDYWIESATFENDFRPVTLPELAKWCESVGIKTSKSALGRWKKKFDWDAQLELKITASAAKGEAKQLVNESSLSTTVEKSNDDFEKNSEAKDLTYALLIHDLKILMEKIQSGGKTSDKDKRFYLKALEILAGREDKLLDRIANSLLVQNLVSPDEAIKALQTTSIEIEEDAIEDAEISIEE